MTFLNDYKGKPRKFSSAEVTSEFLSSGKEAVSVDCEALDNDIQNVYAAVRQYSLRHNLPIVLTMENKMIILRRKVVGQEDEKE